MLAYVNYPEATLQFVDFWFFPFALPFPLELFQPAINASNEFNRARNEYVEYLIDEARRSLDVSAIVKKHTNVQNLTPILLPVRNFRSKHLTTMLANLFWGLHAAPAPDDLIEPARESELRCTASAREAANLE